MPKILVIEEIWDTYFGIRLRFSLKNPKNFGNTILYIFSSKEREKKKEEFLTWMLLCCSGRKGKEKMFVRGRKRKRVLLNSFSSCFLNKHISVIERICFMFDWVWVYRR